MVLIHITPDLWIQSTTVQITVTNAAGVYSSPLTQLDKPGRYAGVAMGFLNVTNNDNSQAIGGYSFRRRNPNATPVYGDAFTEWDVRIVKQVGTAGATIIDLAVMIWLKK